MTEDDGDLTRLGGKGANLQRLTADGHPVPRFVVIDTGEYRAFVDRVGLHATIFDALATGDAATASATIRSAFDRKRLPRAQRARLVAAVASFGDARVAVRSSATAEDLPGLSFAGLHDSFLDAAGAEQVVDRIVACWASLWTERAIAYRVRNGVDQDDLAIAVIVQDLVPAEAAGVMFTANPVSGHRGETVIDAAFGLGDAVVAGTVVPDHVVVDTESGAITTLESAGAEPALTRSQVHELTALGRRITALFGQPQDVEWARVGDAFWIVQSRPVTTLFPVPTGPGIAADETPIWLSFGAVQGMLEPISPLGRDLIRQLFAGGSRVFGRPVDYRANRLLGEAGERLWIRVDGLLSSELGRVVVEKVLPIAEPASAAVLRRLFEDPAWAAEGRVPGAATFGAAGRFFGKVAPWAPISLRYPDAVRTRLDDAIAELLRTTERRLASTRRLVTREARLETSVLAVERFAREVFPVLLPAFGRLMLPSLLLLARLRKLAEDTQLEDAEALTLKVLRSLPGNVTTDMDLKMWDVAQEIRSDPHAWGVVTDTDPVELARRYRAGTLPPVAQGAVAGFLADYGSRGVAEIDVASPRWRDDPTSVMRSLQGFVRIEDAAHNPRATHAQGQVEAEEAIARLARAAGRRDAPQVRYLAGRLRALLGARETPKFAIVRGLALVRERLLEVGAELADAGILDLPDDVFFLTMEELRDAWAASDLRTPVRLRRAAADAERRRRQVPRVLVGDGRAFFEGVVASGDNLAGLGVSPGVVEGPVRIVLDPRTTHLAPGDILVCPGTDPAWTPLFLTAGGLITEMGGLMTHGSVVAREYGIPAIVGVGEATTRLTDGQRVRIDGSAGTVELLD